MGDRPSDTSMGLALSWLASEPSNVAGKSLFGCALSGPDHFAQESLARLLDRVRAAPMPSAPEPPCIVEGCKDDHAGDYHLCPAHLHKLVAMCNAPADGPGEAAPVEHAIAESYDSFLARGVAASAGHRAVEPNACDCGAGPEIGGHVSKCATRRAPADSSSAASEEHRLRCRIVSLEAVLRECLSEWEDETYPGASTDAIRRAALILTDPSAKAAPFTSPDVKP